MNPSLQPISLPALGSRTTASTAPVDRHPSPQFPSLVPVTAARRSVREAKTNTATVPAPGTKRGSPPTPESTSNAEEHERRCRKLEFSVIDILIREVGLPEDELHSATELLEDGFLDSLAVVELVTTLEREFGI